MTSEEFGQWAKAVVSNIESTKDEAEQLARQLEPHDKHAAALLRQLNGVAEDLAAHLKQGLGK